MFRGRIDKPDSSPLIHNYDAVSIMLNHIVETSFATE